MTTQQDVTKLSESLGNVVLHAHEHPDFDGDDDLVSPSIVLESFTNSLSQSRDPIVRESFLETCLDVLKPRGDALDDGRFAVLKDAALPCIPAFIPLVNQSPLVKEILSLIAEHSDAREVLLGLNIEMQRLTELADPYVVSDDEDSDDDDESHEIDWNTAFGELEEIIDMYAIAISRLKTQRSTPTLLQLQDCLIPLLKTIPATSPPELAIDMSRSLLRRVAKLVSAAWKWSETTTDAKGEQKTILTDMIQTAVMIFGPCVGAELTARRFLTTHKRYQGLQPLMPGWEEGQAAFDAATESLKELGVDRKGLAERIVNTSSVRPESSISSLILLGASTPALAEAGEVLAPSKDVIADAMPILTLALSGSAVDAGTALTWALVSAAEQGKVDLEFDQATFFLELIMPLIQNDGSANVRLALSKLLAAVVAATSSTNDQILLLKQLLEPQNPFGGVRVMAVKILRELIATPKGHEISPLLCPKLTEIVIDPILFGPLDEDINLPLPELMGTMWPVWWMECANFFWFLLERDPENKAGFAARALLKSIRNNWFRPLEEKTTVWISQAAEEPQYLLILDGLKDALDRACEAGLKAV